MNTISSGCTRCIGMGVHVAHTDLLVCCMSVWDTLIKISIVHMSACMCALSGYDDDSGPPTRLDNL